MGFHLGLAQAFGVITDATPVAVLVHDEQIVEELPQDPWDLMADLVVTPQRVLRIPAVRRPKGSLRDLPEPLASLPVTQAALGS